MLTYVPAKNKLHTQLREYKYLHLYILTYTYMLYMYLTKKKSRFLFVFRHIQGNQKKKDGGVVPARTGDGEAEE